MAFDLDKLDITSSEAENIWNYCEGKNGELEILEFVGECESDIVIPRTIDGKAVTSLGIFSLAYFREPVNVYIHDLITLVGSFGSSSSPITAFGHSESYLSFTVDENNKTLCSIDGDLYTRDGMTLLIYAGGSDKKSFKLPNGVETVRRGAFENAVHLESVDLSGVKNIEDNAFEGCERLSEIVLGEALCSVGRSILKGTKYHSEESNWENGLLYVGTCLLDANAVYADKIYIKKGTKVISSDLLSSGYGEEREYLRVYFDGQLDEWCSIAHGTPFFETNSKEKQLILRDELGKFAPVIELWLPEGVQRISANAFNGYNALERICLGKSIKSIGKDAFKNCTGATRVYFDGGIADWLSISFENHYSNPLASAHELYLRAENGSYERVRRLQIPKGVKEIPDYAFFGSHISSVSLPSTLRRVGEAAFYACSYLSFVDIPDSVGYIGRKSFYSGSLMAARIGKGVTFIGEECFTGKYCLVEIINNSCVEIDASSALDIHSGESLVKRRDGFLFYTKNGKNYLVGYEGRERELALPSDLDGEPYEIYRYAFVNDHRITGIRIDGEIVVGEGAFSYSKSLSRVELGDGVTVRRGAFESCPKLGTDLLLKHVSNSIIENGCYIGVSSDLRIPYGVKRILPSALSGIEGFRSLTLPSTLSEFAPTCLREAYDANSETVASRYDLKPQPSSLEAVYVSEENESFKSECGAILTKDGKRLIYMPPVRQYTSPNAYIPEGVEELLRDSCCFVHANSIVFPRSLKRIGEYAVCASFLDSSVIPDCEISEGSFKGSVLPIELRLNNRVIPEYAFAYCTAVRRLYIGSGVKRISSFAFLNTAIEEVYVSGDTVIEENALAHKRQRDGEDGCSENSYIISGRMLMYVTAGSPAEKYAKYNGIKYEIIDGESGSPLDEVE